jgi:superfamily I DNA/RNA helicase
MLRVAALLWRGGGEADAVAAVTCAAKAVELMKQSAGKRPQQHELLAVADGLHVSLCGRSLLLENLHVT